MDQNPYEFLANWPEGERYTGSPENSDNHFPGFFADFSGVQGDLAFGRFRMPNDASNGIRAPLPSPTNASTINQPSHSSHHGLLSPVLTSFAPVLHPGYPQFSKRSPNPPAFNGAARPHAHTYPKAFYFQEESTSTDATPESSDVEDDQGMRKKKRGKLLMSDEDAIKHAEEARKFPGFLRELRIKLAGESPDGRIQDAAAISALIQQFTQSDEGERFTLPDQCEIYLKRAAERVQEYRQLNKNSRKKKGSEAAAAAAAASNTNANFVCTSCADQEIKSFKTQEGLNLHIRNKHEPEKQWKCFAPGCTVSFVRQADLRMHLIRMHSPQRPFPCKVPFCLKAFAGVSELRRHVKVDHRPVVSDLTGNGGVHAFPDF